MKLDPRTKSVGARLVVRKLRQAGLDETPILGAAGLKLSAINKEDGWLPYRAVEKLTQIAAEELNDPHLGLHLGEQEDILDYGAIAYIGLSSQTLGDAIENLGRYLHTVTEAWKLELSSDSDGASIVYYPVSSSIHNCRHMAEGAACSLLIAYQTFLDRPLQPRSVSFAHACRVDPHEHEIVLGCPVKFNQNKNRILLKRSDLALPIATANDGLLKTLTGLCEQVYQTRTSAGSSLVARIQKTAIEFIPQGKAHAREIAPEIGMSERSLHRYLAGEGTSFSDILDALKKDLAMKYMSREDLNLTQIAFLLGYSDHSAFSTAFKRWTGHTPRQARASLR